MPLPLPPSSSGDGAALLWSFSAPWLCEPPAVCSSRLIFPLRTQAGGGDLLLRFPSSSQSCCGEDGALQADVTVCAEHSPCSGQAASSSGALSPGAARLFPPRRAAQAARGLAHSPLARRARGRARTNPWLPKPLPAEGKGVKHPGRGRQNCWLPGQSTASAPHTQRHLPAAPRPPRSRTELI